MSKKRGWWELCPEHFYPHFDLLRWNLKLRGSFTAKRADQEPYQSSKVCQTPMAFH